MKKIFLILIILFNTLFALDKQNLLEVVKSNPALLDSPQVKLYLKQQGLKKEDLLQEVKKDKKDDILTIENNITEFSKAQKEKLYTTENNITELNITKSSMPLSYIDGKKLLKQIQKYKQIQKQPKLVRFGEKFFYNKNRLNSAILSVPNYYQLNIGDIVEIQIYGGVNKTYQLQIKNDGNIVLPILGPINIAGKSVYEIKELIKNKLKPTYPNSKILVDVKINSFIQVSLTGYIKAPGIYNLQSLSTIKDLLIAANGFGEIGSMRKVYLKRGGKVLKIIDFYELIKNGKLVDTTILHNGDIIYVPKAKKLVKLYGAVNIPAIYELKGNESLKDLINFAGGISSNGSKSFIKIKRFLNNSKTKIILTSLNKNNKLVNGDEIYIYKISEINDETVYVYGNIDKPGSYELPKDKLLSSLLKNLKYLKDTFYGYGLIERFDSSVVSFDLKNPKLIKLKPKDNIFIFNKYQVKVPNYIIIKGDAVINKGKLLYKKNMSLKDAIFNAGLKKLFDGKKIQLIRYSKDMKPSILYLDYEKDKNFILKPYDEIYIYSYEYFSPNKPISIFGEVNKPDVYTYAKGMELKDLLKLAGWFNDKADKSYIELIRYEIKNNERIRKIIRLSDKDLNYKLKPYDEINVKTIPNWGERKTVEITGEVKYPGVYTIKTGERLYDVIKRAGGFTDEAYLYGAIFTRESVRKIKEDRLRETLYKLKRKVTIIAASAKGTGQSTLDAKNLISAIDSLIESAKKLKPIGRIAIKLDKDLQKFKNSPYNIVLKDKDKLFIPSKTDSIIVMGEVLNESAFVYNNNNALTYIEKAGGLSNDADEIYFVVHANGISEKGELDSWFNDGIEVKPGDVIIVPLKIKTETWYGVAKDITSIVYQLAITAASLKTVGAL